MGVNLRRVKLHKLLQNNKIGSRVIPIAGAVNRGLIELAYSINEVDKIVGFAIRQTKAKKAPKIAQ